MLDIHFIRENLQEVKESIRRRGLTVDLQKLLDLDAVRRARIQQRDALRNQQNQANDGIAAAQGSDRENSIAKMKNIAQEVKALDSQLAGIDTEFNALLLCVPNVIAPDIHDGRDGSDNVEIKRYGEIPPASETPKDHMHIGRDLGIIDEERGVKLFGRRGYVLKGMGAQLETAILQYGLDFLRDRGFTQLNPPLLGKEEIFVGSAHFPGSEDETFYVKNGKSGEREWYLEGTGEVPLMGYRMHETLAIAELPLRYTTATPCFRTEVGNYGKDTSGLYRVHQFMKVEQVVLCEADKNTSKKLFDEILTNAEDFLKSLDLPYRIVRYCTGDLGAKAYRAVDIETWMPSRGDYGETQTCSEILDFQTRRLRIQYRKGNQKMFVYSLNNTLVASPRILIPLLEINQQPDGSIAIPKVLQPYLHGQERIA